MRQDIHPIIRTILQNRGIHDPDDMLEFLSSQPKKTYDPFLMKGMDRAVERIQKAISIGERICIYGDYDADGVTATSLLLQTLSHLTPNLDYYIPSRFDEGYGLNRDALLAIQEEGVSLVITVDCGSISYDEVEYAKTIGLEIIVTDHHNINDRIADCILLNPKQKDCNYPFRELCGCGIAFKLAQALQRSAGLPKQLLNDILDLVAIATVGDIVPLIDENRTLVKYGLQEIKKSKRFGLVQLLDAIHLVPNQIKAWNLAFGIVPHLNAAGRIESARTGVTLLTSKDSQIVQGAVSLLVENNRERRRLQEETLEQLLAVIEEQNFDSKFIFIDAMDAHEGITGIVAGKIKDEFSCPTVIVTETSEPGFVKGTGRSVSKINLYEMLKKYENLFQKFGGHSGACGFMMERAHLETLKAGLIQDAEALYQSNPNLFLNSIEAEAELLPGQISIELIEQLEELEPCGWKNEKPMFRIREATVQNAVYLGENQQHVKMRVLGSDAVVLDCILFQKAAAYRDSLKPGKIVHLIGSPGLNEWNGSKKIQFVVRELT